MKSSNEPEAEAVIDRAGMEQLLRETVDQGRKLSLMVTGHSMGPTLRHGRDSVVLVQPGSLKIKRLDIVLFRRQDGKYVLHRIIRRLPGGGFVVNGDAQVWTEQVQQEQIRAVAGEINRGGRKIDCRGRRYRIYSWIWVFLKPFRGVGISLYHCADRWLVKKNT